MSAGPDGMVRGGSGFSELIFPFHSIDLYCVVSQLDRGEQRPARRLDNPLGHPRRVRSLVIGLIV